MAIKGEVFLFEMENTMAQICNTAKQDSVAQLCSVIVTAFQVLLNYKMEVFLPSNFLYQIFHANIFLHPLYLRGVLNVSLYFSCI